MQRVFAFALILFPALMSADEQALATDTLPAYVLQLPQSVQNVLIAETDTSTLHRYANPLAANSAPDTRYMSVGLNGVGKQKSGDQRTPLGIYFVTGRLDTRLMHEKYGPLAFPLDYPNAWDTSQLRSGDGIWIHGVLPGGERRPPRDTDGCIALPNADLLALEPHVEIMTTPVIITRKMVTRDATELANDRQALAAALAEWAQSFRDGDWHRYQSLYAEEFSYRGLDREGWLAYRVQSGATRPIRDLSVDDVMMLADPEDSGLFLSRFRQTILAESGTIVTIKRLYWQRNDSGDFRIVAEDNG